MDPPAGTKVWASGWGISSHEEKDVVRWLQKLEMKTVSDEECNKTRPGLIHDGHICAIDLDVGLTSTCSVSTLILLNLHWVGRTLCCY